MKETVIIKERPDSFLLFLLKHIVFVLLIVSISFPLLVIGKGDHHLLNLEDFMKSYITVFVLWITVCFFFLRKSPASSYRFSAFGALILDCKSLKISDLSDSLDKIKYEDSELLVVDGENFDVVSKDFYFKIGGPKGNILYYGINSKYNMSLGIEVHNFVFNKLNSKSIAFVEAR